MAKRTHDGLRQDVLRSISGAGILSAVSGGPGQDDPGAGLSDAARAVYDQLVRTLSTGGRDIKYPALLSLSEAAKIICFLREAEDQIAADGLVLTSEKSGACKAHPLLAASATARSSLAKILGSTGLAMKPHHVVAAREQNEADEWTAVCLADSRIQGERRQ